VSDITVSVCIRGFRRETLPQTIASVLQQRRNDIEVIVGDDAGDLEDVVAAFDDPKLRYHRNTRTLGQIGHARALLTQARGRYLCLLDDDDRWLPGFLDQTIMRLDADASVGIVFTNFFYFYAAEERLHACRSSLASGRHEHFLPTLLRGEAPMPPSVTLMRREVWEDGERRHPILDDAWADATMWIRAADAGWAFYFVDAPLALYTVHPWQVRVKPPMLERSVRVFERFSFQDAQCEYLRRRNLAAAFLACANTKLACGRVRDAMKDVAAARAASPRRLGLREAVVLLGLPALARRLLGRHPRFFGLFETVRHLYRRVLPLH
jgi:glycosyltransferase involved in cell wall biosynthesis